MDDIPEQRASGDQAPPSSPWGAPGLTAARQKRASGEEAERVPVVHDAGATRTADLLRAISSLSEKNRALEKRVAELQKEMDEAHRRNDAREESQRFTEGRLQTLDDVIAALHANLQDLRLQRDNAWGALISGSHAIESGSPPLLSTSHIADESLPLHRVLDVPPTTGPSVDDTGAAPATASAPTAPPAPEVDQPSSGQSPVPPSPAADAALAKTVVEARAKRRRQTRGQTRVLWLGAGLAVLVAVAFIVANLVDGGSESASASKWPSNVLTDAYNGCFQSATQKHQELAADAVAGTCTCVLAALTSENAWDAGQGWTQQRIQLTTDTIQPRCLPPPSTSSP